MLLGYIDGLMDRNSVGEIGLMGYAGNLIGEFGLVEYAVGHSRF